MWIYRAGNLGLFGRVELYNFLIGPIRIEASLKNVDKVKEKQAKIKKNKKQQHYKAYSLELYLKAKLALRDPDG